MAFATCPVFNLLFMSHSLRHGDICWVGKTPPPHRCPESPRCLVLRVHALPSHPHPGPCYDWRVAAFTGHGFGVRLLRTQKARRQRGGRAMHEWDPKPLAHATCRTCYLSHQTSLMKLREKLKNSIQWLQSNTPSTGLRCLHCAPEHRALCDCTGHTRMQSALGSASAIPPVILIALTFQNPVPTKAVCFRMGRTGHWVSAPSVCVETGSPSASQLSVILCFVTR